MKRAVDMIDAEDKLTFIKCLVEIVFMAATDINDKAQRDAIQTVCDIADDHINELKDILEAARGEQS